MRGGTIPGAGSTLFGASDTLGTTEGELVLAQALKQPAIQILTNAGFYSEEVFMQLAYNAGLDVATGAYTPDLAGQGIVDPAESAISSVNVAVSTAGLLMTAGSLITDVEKKHDKTE
jgi:chaperonin GroEL (HSP60 family)